MAVARALICTAPGQLEVQSVPLPQLLPGHVLVKARAVALNPTDNIGINNPDGSGVGSRFGVDFAGVIEQVGPGVTRPLRRGDRVCGSVFGGRNAESGAFGEYVVAKEYLLIKIPDHVSFEQSATLGVGLTTCGQTLYQRFALPLPPTPPTNPPQTILINGGSTATAVLGIQYAKLSGLHVIATASAYNFDYLRSLGADVLLDYHDSVDDLVSKIRQYTSDNLVMAWDCSPNDKFPIVAARSMSRSRPATYTTVSIFTPPDHLRGENRMVECKWQLGYTVFGQAFSLAQCNFPISDIDVEFAKKFWNLTGMLLESGQIQPTRQIVNRGGSGLEGIVLGLRELGEGKVSGGKLVYTL